MEKKWTKLSDKSGLESVICRDVCKHKMKTSEPLVRLNWKIITVVEQVFNSNSNTLTQLQLQVVWFAVERSGELDPHLEGLSSADDQLVAEVSVCAMLTSVRPILGLQEVDGAHRQKRVWRRERKGLNIRIQWNQRSELISEIFLLLTWICSCCRRRWGCRCVRGHTCICADGGKCRHFCK